MTFQEFSDAFDDRVVVHRAVGVLASLYGVGPGQAAALLLDAARTSGASVRAVAERLVADAYGGGHDQPRRVDGV